MPRNMVIYKDPFTDVPHFNSMSSSSSFGEWYRNEFKPVAKHAGLSAQKLSQQMRVHLDKYAKKAYDVALGKFGARELNSIVRYLRKQIRDGEGVTVALYDRKMGEHETVTQYSLELQSLFDRVYSSNCRDAEQKNLMRAFRKGIPKSLFDMCNMYPRPRTFEKTVDHVRHYEKRWREERRAMQTAAA